MTGGAGQRTFADATPARLDEACRLAAAAHARGLPWRTRAALLRGSADATERLGDELVRCVTAETNLPEARVVAERGRTCGQLRGFAALLEEGSWVDARIDRAQPQRQPAPRPDLRRMLVGLGPVAVFGASNFPLAYSVAGGDTASALAAGCPVVHKAHPAHPATCELVGGAITATLTRLGIEPGWFTLLHGREPAVGGALVRHPAIAAAGFTGSPAGGRALCELGAARPRPIPVFAEMGSTNPVFVLPGRLAATGAQVAATLAASGTQTAGQFCTCPGIVAYVHGPGADVFVAAMQAAVAAVPAAPTTHAGIAQNYRAALAAWRSVPGVRALVTADVASADGTAAPALWQVDGSTFRQQPRLREEVFGPSLLLVRCADAAELRAVADSLDGSLTATVHGDDGDFGSHRELLAVLQRKAGRLIRNGVPTGVEVVPAMVHGGPWPASSDSRFTAVGTAAILRWARPVCWQDWPAAALPEELQDGNPRGIWRTVDGEFGRH